MNEPREPKIAPINHYREAMAVLCETAGLTARQKSVWLGTMDGYTDAEMAQELRVSAVCVQETRAAAANKLRALEPEPRDISKITLLKCVANKPEIEREPGTIAASQDYSARPKAFGEVAGDLRTAEDAPLSVALGLACKITGTARPRLMLRTCETRPKRTADECHAERLQELRELGQRLAKTR